MDKIKKSLISTAINVGIKEFEKHNPTNDKRYPVSTYILHYILNAIENHFASEKGLKAYSGWKFIDWDK